MLQPSTKLKATPGSGDILAGSHFCDWIEASTLFESEGSLSFPDIVAFLVGEELCHDQEQAWVCLTDALREMRRRAKSLGIGYPLTIRNNRFDRRRGWRDCPAYSFCLLLSLAKVFPSWANSFGPNYTKQGELFEKLTAEALTHILKSWKIYQTGWSSSHAQHLRVVVANIVSLIGEPAGDIDRWADDHAKECGLDILCFRAFPDGRGALPVYLVQCASGRDYANKLRDPDLNLWKKLLDTAVEPQRAVAVPYSFHDRDFQRHALSVQGLLLDRYRLLEPLRSQAPWLSNKTRRAMLAWAVPRVKALPWVI